MGQICFTPQSVFAGKLQNRPDGSRNCENKSRLRPWDTERRKKEPRGGQPGPGKQLNKEAT